MPILNNLSKIRLHTKMGSRYSISPLALRVPAVLVLIGLLIQCLIEMWSVTWRVVDDKARCGAGGWWRVTGRAPGEGAGVRGKTQPNLLCKSWLWELLGSLWRVWESPYVCGILLLYCVTSLESSVISTFSFSCAWDEPSVVCWKHHSRTPLREKVLSVFFPEMQEISDV